LPGCTRPINLSSILLLWWKLAQSQRIALFFAGSFHLSQRPGLALQGRFAPQKYCPDNLLGWPLAAACAAPVSTLILIYKHNLTIEKL
jgi:hypothetical protein